MEPADGAPRPVEEEDMLAAFDAMRKRVKEYFADMLSLHEFSMSIRLPRH